MSRDLEFLGKLAWHAYMADLLPKIGIDPNVEVLREWLDLPEQEREAWGAAASKIATEFKRRTQDVFYGFAELA